MPDFRATDETVLQISAQFGVDEHTVTVLRNFYRQFSEDMKFQYLAHVIRTMEERLRKVSKNQLFRIVCTPIDENSKQLGIACAQYYKNNYFAIYYHPKTDPKQLRVLLAHELGHLFLVELLNSTLDESYTEEDTMEPLSTVLGILVILDKNEFYHNKTVPYKHKTPDEVIKDFSLLLKRDGGQFNIS